MFTSTCGLFYNFLITLTHEKMHENINVIKCLYEVSRASMPFANIGIASYYISNNIAAPTMTHEPDIPLIKYLIANGADIHEYEEWALCNAAQRGYEDIVRYLVSQGADIHVGEYNAIGCASYGGHEDIVRYLVSIGADVNDGMRHSNGHDSVVRYLVSLGADIHISGEIALRRAAYNHNRRLVEYLISIGADVKNAIKHEKRYHVRGYLSLFLNPS